MGLISVAQVLMGLFVFISINGLFAQLSNRNKTEKDILFGANFHYGKVVKHTKKFLPDIPNQAVMAEFNLGLRASGKKLWHHRFRFPETGIALIYSDYGNQLVLGRGAGIFPYIGFPLAARGRYAFHVRIGSGIAWLNKHFHIVNNPENNVIGSRINNVTQLKALHFFRLADRWLLQAGFAFTHFSNGNFQKPNLGINVLSGCAGLIYRPNPSSVKHQADTSQPYVKRWMGFLKAGMAVNEAKTPGAGKYPIYAGMVAAVKPVSRYNRLLAGLEYEFRGDMYVTLQSRIERQDRISLNSVNRLATIIGDELVFGNVALSLQIGFYVNRFEEKPFLFYNKNGLIYYLPLQKKKQWLFLSAFLKSHLVVADYIEIGVGCLF